jgi:GntR family transcriptional regulator/MocR family aminotransferase
LVLSGGHPDLRLLPLAELGRAWRRVLGRGARSAAGGAIVDYGDPRGQAALRQALADWLRRRRGLDVDPAGLMVTRGAQQAIGLAVLSTVAPGARVAVEALGYGPAWSAIRLAGAVPVPVPVDDQGMVVDALEGLDVSAVYTTPHHQYPTMVGLSPARRSALLAFAARRRIPVIEDDYDHEFHWTSAPRLPLARGDGTGQVLYVGTLSKALAPGLRIGFLVAPPAVIERAARYRTALDRQGDGVTERAIAELLQDGEIDRHISRMHKVYAARQQRTLALARATLGRPIVAPDGGLALWAESPIDPVALRVAAAMRGVTFQIGADHTFDGRADPHLRLGFANLEEDELEIAFARLAMAIEDLGGPR